MAWLYRIGIGLYHAALRLAARWGHPRARAWVTGRRTAPDLSGLAGRPVIWLHAASLGEFEQGRPVLAALRQLRPDAAVLVTFFSPSGYERCRNTELAEAVAYLPPDGPDRAAAWVAKVRPALAIFVKYEFWYYHLAALHAAGVPTFLIAASFRPDQIFFRPYGGWWRQLLQRYTHLAVQTSADAALLRAAGLPPDRYTVTGDPRGDRTLQLARDEFHDPILAAFTDGHPTLFAGSVWPPDVDALAAAWPALPPEWRLVLAPHQLQESEIAAWQGRFAAERYTAGGRAGSRVLILDTIGVLSRAYRYGDLAYVGGGFRTGLHNTLEPMSYGLPVVFGPRHRKFPEAAAAIARGGGFSIASGAELRRVLLALADPTTRARATAAQRALAADNAGAAQRTAELVVRLSET